MILVQDNLDVACSAIEKVAIERVVSDIDKAFLSAYEVRRRHREVSALGLPLRSRVSSNLKQLRNGQPFWDSSAPQSNYSANLPDPLRIKGNGLQPAQMSVYEDFGEP
jgi:CCR4-NOT transcription complex subunit 1